MSTDAYGGARSGGKIVNRRRWRFSKSTPYDRPPPPPAPESPNWLTGVVFPATRTIVSGAAKLLSSVFDSSSSSSSSSASDSSSSPDSNSIDEDDINDDHDNQLLEETECAATDAEHCQGMSKSKCLIEKLLMRETFSRAECDKFITLINSRAVDSPMLDYGLQHGVPYGSSVAGTFDPCSKAITEAREWVKNKKDELHLVPLIVDRDCSPRSFVTENMEKEDGSPMYVAKSYMKTRPPWASPHDEYHTRTPSMMSKLLSEGTSFPGSDDSMSSSRRKNALASGSWNIYEEIRRVRSKATDDMLHSLSSKKSDLPLLSEQRMKRKTLIGDWTTLGDRAHAPGSLSYLSKSSTPALATDIGLSETGQVVGESVNVILDSPGLSIQEAQGNDQVEVAGEPAAFKSHQPSGLVLVSENVHDPESSNNIMENDVPPLETSLRGAGEHQLMQTNMIKTLERPNNDDDAQAVQVKCEFLSEAFVEVPNNGNEMS